VPFNADPELEYPSIAYKVSKLHNHRYPPGLERELLRKIPKYLLGSILIPLFMVILVRLPPVESLFASTAEAAEKLHTTIDFLSIAIFVGVLPVILALFIGCIIVILMKGPAYTADAYDVDDADEPDDDKKDI
jgi:polyferredoxin